jgi:hypothetical protein
MCGRGERKSAPPAPLPGASYMRGLLSELPSGASNKHSSSSSSSSSSSRGVIAILLPSEGRHHR